jgi:hypothetical protein
MLNEDSIYLDSVDKKTFINGGGIIGAYFFTLLIVSSFILYKYQQIKRKKIEKNESD